jgi:hypothetical protein
VNVFAPAIVCVPVDTSHRAVSEAFGRLKVCTDPDETILKSFPVVPIANVCPLAVSPLSVPILLLNLVQSILESAPVVVVFARARESPVHTSESPLRLPEMNPILLLKVFQSDELSAPVVEVLARAREIPVPVIVRPFGVPETKPIFVLNIFQSVEEIAPVVVELAILMLNIQEPEL